MSKGKIAFLKNGSFSHLNEFIFETLSKAFPEYVVDIYDIKKDIINPVHFINLAHIFKEYGTDVLFGKKHLANCQIKTTYMFHKIKKNISNKLKNENYQFTFQSQSLFDASVEGIPHFVYSDHTHLANLYYPLFDKSQLFSDAWIKLERSIYENARLNFTMSSNISRSLVEHYDIDPAKVCCVFAGNNVQNSDEPVNEQKYAQKNILFVGVNWERKGGPLLAAAFKNVLNVHQDATLTIVGCSPDLDLPNCTIVGRIPLEKVAYYYKNASIFCLPTNIEPFGIVFLEAITYKLPIIGTNIGAIPDMVSDGETGYLIEPNDQTLLEQKLIELLDSPVKCSDFGKKGYTLNKKKYSWDSVGAAIRSSIEKELFQITKM